MLDDNNIVLAPCATNDALKPTSKTMHGARKYFLRFFLRSLIHFPSLGPVLPVPPPFADQKALRLFMQRHALLPWLPVGFSFFIPFYSVEWKSLCTKHENGKSWRVVEHKKRKPELESGRVLKDGGEEMFEKIIYSRRKQ